MDFAMLRSSDHGKLLLQRCYWQALFLVLPEMLYPTVSETMPITAEPRFGDATVALVARCYQFHFRNVSTRKFPSAQILVRHAIAVSVAQCPPFA
jgi:hypothetical protein